MPQVHPSEVAGDPNDHSRRANACKIENVKGLVLAFHNLEAITILYQLQSALFRADAREITGLHTMTVVMAGIQGLHPSAEDRLSIPFLNTAVTSVGPGSGGENLSGPTRP